MTTYRVLGQIEVSDGQQTLPLGGPRQVMLLAYLLLNANRAIPSDVIAERLWSQAADGSLKRMQMAVARLRKALEPLGSAGLRTVSGGYVFTVAEGELDADVFETSVMDGRDALERGDAERARLTLATALALWRGPALAEVAFHEFAQAEIRRLDELRLIALETRIEADLLLDRHREVIGEIATVLAGEPARERLAGQLMLALYRSGRQADALEVFQRTRVRLDTELGLAPGPALQRLQAQILDHDPSLVGTGRIEAGDASLGHRRPVAFAFTEVVLAGATPAVAAQIRRQRYGELRQLAHAVGGEDVKTIGTWSGADPMAEEGLIIACSSAATAVSCALAIRQKAWLSSPRFGVRLGVSFGEADADGDRWHGSPVDEAVRLCAAADEGQILLADTVPRTGMSAHEPVTLTERHGFTVPLQVWSVAGEMPSVSLPAPLAAAPASVFVGREPEMAQFGVAWAQAKLRQRGLVLVSGEAGIGKTRFVAEMARLAHVEDGATVLYGRSADMVGLPYEPWRQTLRHAINSWPDELLRAHIARHGGELSRLAPSLKTRFGSAAEPSVSDPETERYLLFAAVVGLLEDLAGTAPVMLILDDLQWAGSQTMALLRHVELSAPPELQLLIVATWREEDIPSGQPFLPDLERESAERNRIRLSGLDTPSARSLLDDTVGDRLGGAGAALASDIHSRTGGNPFFLKEIVRDLTESGALRRDKRGRWLVGDVRLGVPRRVREVIRSRVSRMSHDAERVLSIAAVIGREFTVGLLTRVENVPNDIVLSALDDAVERHLLLESADRPGTYAFVHALVAEALAQGVGAGRRAQLHQRVALALEERPSADPGEIARHWLGAGPGSSGRAIVAARKAGRAALTQLAPDEATRWFERALALHDELADAPGGERRELLLGLGEAQAHVGSPDFRETLLAAADEALTADDDERLVRAALANTRGVFSSAGFVDEERVGVLEAALDRTSADDPARARVLALLAAELLWQPDERRRRALSDEAVALARADGGVPSLVHALRWRVLAVWWPETLPDRLRTTDELMALTERSGDPLARFWALHWRAVTVVQDGQPRQADECLDEARSLLDGLRYRRLDFVLAAAEGWRAQLEGRLHEAEERAEYAAQIGQEAEEPDAISLWLGQLGPIRWHQGRLVDQLDVLESIADDVPGVSIFRAMTALAHAEAGRVDDARRQLATAAADRFDGIPADPVRLGSLTIWAEVAARLNARPAAEVLLGILVPLRDQVVLDALGTLGSVSRAAALVADVLGRRDEADRYFADALQAHEGMGARSLIVRTRLEWALALAQRGESADDDRSRDGLVRAASEARDLVLPGLEARARVALADLDSRAAVHAVGGHDGGRNGDGRAEVEGQ